MKNAGLLAVYSFSFNLPALSPILPPSLRIFPILADSPAMLFISLAQADRGPPMRQPEPDPSPFRVDVINGWPLASKADRQTGEQKICLR